MNDDKVSHYCVMPCKIGEDGKVVVDYKVGPPYGFHHIRRIYTDGSWWTVAHINCDVGREALMAIANIIADGAEVRIKE